MNFVSYTMVHIARFEEVYFYIRNKSCCFYEMSFVKVGLYCTCTFPLNTVSSIRFLEISERKHSSFTPKQHQVSKKYKKVAFPKNRIHKTEHIQSNQNRQCNLTLSILAWKTAIQYTASTKQPRFEDCSKYLPIAHMKISSPDSDLARRL